MEIWQFTVCNASVRVRAQVCENVGLTFLVGYLLPFALTVPCVVYAFKIRKAPDGFNEARNLGTRTRALFALHVRLNLQRTSTSTGWRRCEREKEENSGSRVAGFVIHLGAVLDLLVILAIVLDTPYAIKMCALAAVSALKGLSLELGLFLHKLYVVLCTPQKNTREAVLHRKRTGTTWRSSSAASDFDRTTDDTRFHFHTEDARSASPVVPAAAAFSRARDLGAAPGDARGSLRVASVAARFRTLKRVQTVNGAVGSKPRISSVSSWNNDNSISEVCAPVELRAHRQPQEQDPDVTIYSIAGSMRARCQNGPASPPDVPETGTQDAAFVRNTERKSLPLVVARSALNRINNFIHLSLYFKTLR